MKKKSDPPENRAREIFLHALAIQEPEPRRSYLEQSCRGDLELLERVNALLANHMEDSFLETPARDEFNLDSATTFDEVSQNSLRNLDLFSERIRYFGDYELLEEIARGGMGVVYKARQTSLNRIVAVKMILSGELASEKELRRFHTEAEAAANLQHPNIVSIHEVGEHEGRHYFSMDYVEGEDLGEYLKSGPMDPREAAGLLKQITEAVAYAHMQGTLHRDIKPANILIDKQGKPRVTDFGLARKLEGSDGVTLSGAILGTPAFMAPEQAEGRLDQLDGRTDIYGLGALLYAMITGRPPFTGESTLEVLRKVMDAPPKPPSVENPNVPRDLEIICLKCLNKFPNNRYLNAIDLAADLARFLNHQSIQAKPASRFERIGQWLRSNPWALVVTLSFVVVLLVLSVFNLWQFSEYIIWKSEHPSQKYQNPFGNFEFILNNFHGLGIVSFLFVYLLVGPPAFFASFAELKKTGRMTPPVILNFTVLAFFNLILGLGAMFGGVYYVVWTHGIKLGSIPLFTLGVLPNFWFSSWLLWLVHLERHGRRFGEHKDRIQALYGADWKEEKKPMAISRAQSNFRMGYIFALVWLSTIFLHGMVESMLVFGSSLLTLTALWIWKRRSRLFGWKVFPKVQRELFLFVVPVAGFIFLSFLGSLLGVAIERHNPFRALGLILIGILVVLLDQSIFRRLSCKLEKADGIPMKQSSLYAYMKSSRSRQSVVILMIILFYLYIFLIISRLGPIITTIFAGLFSFLLAVKMIESLANPISKDLRHNIIEMALFAVALYYLGVVSPTPGFAHITAVGCLIGLGLNGLVLWTLPTADWVKAVWSSCLITTVSVFILTRHNFLENYPRDAQAWMEIGGFEMSGDAMGWNLTEMQGKVDALNAAKAYERLGFLRRGLRTMEYWERMTLPEPTLHFDVLLAKTGLLRASGKFGESQNIQRKLMQELQLSSVKDWKVAGPFIPTSDPLALGLFEKPFPVDALNWTEIAVQDLSFEGCLDFNEVWPPSGNRPYTRIAYAKLEFNSPIQQDVELRFGLHESTMAWLNGDPILNTAFQGSYFLDNFKLKTTFAEGVNVLVVRSIDKNYPWKLLLRILDAEGRFIQTSQSEG